MVIKDIKSITKYILQAEANKLKAPVVFKSPTQLEELLGKYIILVPFGFNKEKIKNIGTNLCVDFKEFYQVAKLINTNSDSKDLIIGIMRAFNGTIK